MHQSLRHVSQCVTFQLQSMPTCVGPNKGINMKRRERRNTGQYRGWDALESGLHNDVIIILITIPRNKPLPARRITCRVHQVLHAGFLTHFSLERRASAALHQSALPFAWSFVRKERKTVGKRAGAATQGEKETERHLEAFSPGGTRSLLQRRMSQEAPELDTMCNN